MRRPLNVFILIKREKRREEKREETATTTSRVLTWGEGEGEGGECQWALRPTPSYCTYVLVARAVGVCYVKVATNI